MTDVLVVDDRLHAQALGVLERERPDDRAERLFRLHNRLVLGFFNVTLLYLSLSFLTWRFLDADSAFTRSLSIVIIRPLALVVLVLLVLSVLASLLNFGLLLRLLRLARLERRLRQPWRSKNRLRVRLARRPAAIIKRLVLGGLGLLLMAFGALGVVVESWAAPMLLNRQVDPAKRQLAIATTLCGASSILLIYLDAGRRRLDVVSDLRASLLRNEGVIPGPVWDRIAAADRAQAEASRLDSLKVESRRQEQRFTYNESRAFVDAKQALPDPVLLDVLNATAGILENPRVSPTASDRALCYEPIAGTDLELGYLVEPRARVITFFGLNRTGSERPALDEAVATDTPDYRIDKRQAAREACDQLSADERAAVDGVLAKVARDPDEQQYLASPRPNDHLVRRLESPSLELDYTVDRKTKTVVVWHIGRIAMRARQQLFVSYSHADREAFLRVMRFLSPLEDGGLVKIWSDDHSIEAGTRWELEIGRALDSAHAALLLVSPTFFTSEFIQTRELPRLLRRTTDGFRLYWMQVRKVVEPDALKEIAAYQALLVPPELSLEELERDARRCESELIEVSRKLAAGFGQRA